MTELEKWDPMTMRIRDRMSPANSILNNYDQKFQEFLILNTASLTNSNARIILDHVMGKTQIKDITLIDFVN